MQRVVLTLVTVAALGCGARTGFGEGASPSSSGGPGAAPCARFEPSAPAVVVSSIPSIVEPMMAIAVDGGFVVGFADEQFPPVDPSWHARRVGLDGSLGDDHVVFHRDTSGIGWTAISFARGASGAAALASDASQGAQLVAIDDGGAPIGAPAHLGDDGARFLAATSAGWSAVRSAFDDTGTMQLPVRLEVFTDAGALASSRVLLAAAPGYLGHERVALDDGSSLFTWLVDPCGAGCRAVHALHVDEDGAPLAAERVMHTFAATEYASPTLAASGDHAVMAWTERVGGAIGLFTQPFGVDGVARGEDQLVATLPLTNAPTLAVAGTPNGGFLAAWVDGFGDSSPSAHALALTPDGAAASEPTTLAEIHQPSNDGIAVAAASDEGAVVTYASDVAGGVEVSAVPLRCAE